MLYNNNDIDIFVLTYNRVNLISDTLNSFLNQTIKNLPITVIDNGSNDGTKEFVINNYPNIDYIREDVNIGPEIFKKIKNYIKRPLLIVFHDDDLISENYIETVLEKYNQYPDLNLILSYTRLANDFTNISIDNGNKDNYILTRHSSKLAKLFFLELPIPFCSAIYKSNIFIQNNIEIKNYGKIFDRAFLINCIKNNGKLLILKSKFIVTRIHDLQDTKSISTGPFDHELIKLASLYKSELNFKLSYQILWNSLIVTKIFLWDEWINNNSNIQTKFNLFNKFKEANVVSNINFLGLPLYYLYMFAKKSKNIIKQ
jgi:glycosyltransferase involved in cell wall biosynthesis